MRYITLSFVLTFSLAAFGSGWTPCSQFVSADGKNFLLSQAFKASDLVVIGQTAFGEKPMLKIKKIIKGGISVDQVELTPAHCQGTACSGGFSVAPKMDLLFLLKKEGVAYGSVTGNGNFSCPVVFEIEQGAVKFGNQKIPIGSVRHDLEAQEKVIPL